MDTYDQREAIFDAKMPEQTAWKTLRATDQQFRVMRAALDRAEMHRYVLVVCNKREDVMRLSCFIPSDLSRYCTVRCADSHPDLDWEHWCVPGWENHELFVEKAVIEARFPKLVKMLNY